MKNWRFSTNISLYFENNARYGHSYNGRPLTADSFAVSCIGSGWVGSIFLDLRWVGLGHSIDGWSWVGSPKMDPRTTLAPINPYACSNALCYSNCCQMTQQTYVQTDNKGFALTSAPSLLVCFKPPPQGGFTRWRYPSVGLSVRLFVCRVGV